MPAYDIYKHKTQKRRSYNSSNSAYSWFRDVHTATRQMRRHDDTTLLETWNDQARRGLMPYKDGLIYAAAFMCASQNCE